MSRFIHLLSGGAAQGLVNDLKPSIEIATSTMMSSTFGAVGLMKQKLIEGAPCDVVILTAALIEQLTASGHVLAGSARHLGPVKTGVAVKSGSPWPQVETAEQLKAAMLAATGIYFPEPQLATAGIHFMKVLNGLGIADTVASKLRPYPNGNTAMNAMAACDDPQVIGCTQVTEILITAGVDLVANLPIEFELATMYTAGVRSTSTCAQQAQAMIDILTSSEHANLRARGGFLPVA
ncbi:substrate-binding domain-containing protein [Limnohabitans sp. Rim8]|uniref:molybdate ABC transporter substrate-binding protein n=1 Tax=Limnohabitans sp. Rim8 TaxID=1100718 RepID=UPI00330665F2